MKDIKFRAWHKTEEVMFEVGGLSNIDYEIESPYRYVTVAGKDAGKVYETPAQIQSVHLMQYTGLKDKNGVEIYEGDLLRVPSMRQYEDTTYICYEVFWHDNNSCEHHIGWQMNRMHLQGNSAGGYGSPQFKPAVTAQFAVIGNIYESPELLK